MTVPFVFPVEHPVHRLGQDQTTVPPEQGNRCLNIYKHIYKHACKDEVTGFLSILGRVGEGGASGNEKKKVRNEQLAFCVTKNTTAMNKSVS